MLSYPARLCVLLCCFFKPELCLQVSVVSDTTLDLDFHIFTNGLILLKPELKITDKSMSDWMPSRLTCTGNNDITLSFLHNHSWA